jgi:hypothetical protein
VSLACPDWLPSPPPAVAQSAAPAAHRCAVARVHQRGRGLAGHGPSRHRGRHRPPGRLPCRRRPVQRWVARVVYWSWQSCISVILLFNKQLVSTLVPSFQPLFSRALPLQILSGRWPRRCPGQLRPRWPPACSTASPMVWRHGGAMEHMHPASRQVSAQGPQPCPYRLILMPALRCPVGSARGGGVQAGVRNPRCPRGEGGRCPSSR